MHTQAMRTACACLTRVPPCCCLPHAAGATDRRPQGAGERCDQAAGPPASGARRGQCHSHQRVHLPSCPGPARGPLFRGADTAAGGAQRRSWFGSTLGELQAKPPSVCACCTPEPRPSCHCVLLQASPGATSAGDGQLQEDLGPVAAAMLDHVGLKAVARRLYSFDGAAQVSQLGRVCRAAYSHPCLSCAARSPCCLRTGHAATRSCHPPRRPPPSCWWC